MSVDEKEKTIAVLQQENECLQTTVEELSILNDISTAISSSMSLEEIQSMLIKKCIKYLVVEEALVSLFSEIDSTQVLQTLLRKPNTIFESVPKKLDDMVIGWVMKNKTTLMVNNFAEDVRFNYGNKNGDQLKSLLCAPMFVKGKMIGLIALFNKVKGDFTINDQRLLSICASQSAQVIENARLYNQEKVLIKLMEEMSLASQIQKNLLPQTPFTYKGFTIYGATNPSKEVGGDFFDYIPLTNNKAAIWLGDVSGKGIPASLLMATIQGVLRSKSMDSNSCISTLQFLNEIILRNNEEDKYATLFYSILNFDLKELTFISAAHESIVHFHNKSEFNVIKTKDIPVGIIEPIQFTEQKINFNPGDFLLVYSDGITEAENIDEVPLGFNRLLEIVKASSMLLPEEIINKIYSEVNSYSAGVPRIDDQTLLIIKMD